MCEIVLKKKIHPPWLHEGSCILPRSKIFFSFWKIFFPITYFLQIIQNCMSKRKKVLPSQTHTIVRILTSLWPPALLTPDCGRGWRSHRFHPRAAWSLCIYSFCASFRSIRAKMITGWKIECLPPAAECNQIFLWQQQNTTGGAGGLMVSWNRLLGAGKVRD